MNYAKGLFINKQMDKLLQYKEKHQRQQQQEEQPPKVWN